MERKLVCPFVSKSLKRRIRPFRLDYMYARVGVMTRKEGQSLLSPENGLQKSSVCCLRGSCEFAESKVAPAWVQRDDRQQTPTLVFLYFNENREERCLHCACDILSDHSGGSAIPTPFNVLISMRSRNRNWVIITEERKESDTKEKDCITRKDGEKQWTTRWFSRWLKVRHNHHPM